MRLFCLSALALAAGIATAATTGPLAVYPNTVELVNKEAHQQLIAEFSSNGFDTDATAKASWTSSNPKVASVSAAGLVSPIADGDATVTAAYNGVTASTIIHVKNSQAPFTWSFRNHVTPVLTKMGCNQGACHGAAAGKNGFKLSLRGYDPETDYDTLTRVAVARRVSLSDPKNSLMLLKPSFAVPHGGGQRFKKDSLEYRVILEWISAGAPAPAANDPTVRSLELFPKTATLHPGEEQQFVVRAKYSDGHTEDVTRWVKFASTNEGTATVDNWGKAKATGAGEAAITVYYQSRVLYARVISPYTTQIAAADWNNLPQKNFIDKLVLEKLKRLNIAPSKVCTDSEFIRRAYLDATGVLPTAGETEDFLGSKDPAKREKLVDSLLQRDEFVDYWAYKWSDLMLVSSKKLNRTAVFSFYDWIHQSVKDNKPWDQFAREIFMSTGSTRSNGALNYFVIHKDPIDISENASEAFLGQRITCARCHNHPLEKWTQKQYYQMANLFSRVGLKDGDPGDVTVYAKTSGDVEHPRLRKALAPAPLDAPPISLDSPEDRRVVFANWLTSPDNPYFAKNVVNRVWGNFMGRGIVHPVDDLRSTNPASNEELLAALADHFVQSRYNVKQLIRTIMTSGTYQLSSEANASNKDDNIYYSKYIVKRLPAEVILDAYSELTGVPTQFPEYPAGTRALQLPDSRVQSRFLNVFGRPERNICDSSERSSDATISQALHIINGDTLNKKLSDPQSNIGMFLKLGLSDQRIFELLTLSGFSRYPTEQEKQTVSELLAKSEQTGTTAEAKRDLHRQALEDMVWALATSKEFLFNH
jgi:hypothetical protein